MDDCCVEKAAAVEQLRERQAATLRAALAANTVMFFLELRMQSTGVPRRAADAAGNRAGTTWSAEDPA